MKYLKNILKNKDAVIAYLPLGSALLYSIGGSGWLACRRYFLPIFITLCLFWVVRDITKGLLSLISGAVLSFSLHLGYGNAIADKNLLYLALLGALYAVGTIGYWFIYSRKKFCLFLRILIPAWFLWSIGLSNDWFGYNLEWKIAEAGVGFLIGVVCLIDIWGKWKDG